MKLTSYCLDTSQPFDRGSSKPLEGHYDVTVVGRAPQSHSVEDHPLKEFRLAGDPRIFGRPRFLPILGAYYRMKDLVT